MAEKEEQVTEWLSKKSRVEERSMLPLNPEVAELRAELRAQRDHIRELESKVKKSKQGNSSKKERELIVELFPQWPEEVDDVICGGPTEDINGLTASRVLTAPWHTNDNFLRLTGIAEENAHYRKVNGDIKVTTLVLRNGEDKSVQIDAWREMAARLKYIEEGEMITLTNLRVKKADIEYNKGNLPFSLEMKPRSTVCRHGDESSSSRN